MDSYLGRVGKKEQILGASVLPLLGWGIHLTIQVQKIRADVDIIVRGNNDMTKIVEDNTRAIKSLTHYLKWMCLQQAGEQPPPPLED